jgi:hypothetical protein
MSHVRGRGGYNRGVPARVEQPVSPAQKHTFLNAFSQERDVRVALKRAGMTQSHLDEAQDDPEFVAKFTAIATATAFTPADETQKRLFLIYFAQLLSVFRACQQAGITRRHLDHALAGDPAFASEFAEVEKEAMSRIESNLIDIATQDPVTARWLLERRDPRYTGKAQVDLNVRSYQDIADLSPEQFEALKEQVGYKAGK